MKPLGWLTFARDYLTALPGDDGAAKFLEVGNVSARQVAERLEAIKGYVVRSTHRAVITVMHCDSASIQASPQRLLTNECGYSTSVSFDAY
ncbi:hypothetical protein G7077_06905 [Sphingomonas piscis]|uniref:Uncharacterized protein n=1 Tax=Sphingomonas piscis TaxID=2714943 RepID=A0A6G7YPL0_9SPHN|nr:hypothetical protein [Sphingomonas piscis]QIK78667.1 hypothetical protein G7077_06905 [Sphingomonas piscis]